MPSIHAPPILPTSGGSHRYTPEAGLVRQDVGRDPSNPFATTEAAPAPRSRRRRKAMPATTTEIPTEARHDVAPDTVAEAVASDTPSAGNTAAGGEGGLIIEPDAGEIIVDDTLTTLSGRTAADPEVE